MTSLFRQIASRWRRGKDRRRQRTLPTTIWLHLVATFEESGWGSEERPNEYQVILPEADYDLLSKTTADLEIELASRLEQEAHARGRILSGPVKVSITFGQVDRIQVEVTRSIAAELSEVDKETTLVFELRRRNRPKVLPSRSLVVLSGPDRGTTFTLWGERVLVGRRETNHVVLHDDRVSRVHLAILWSDGQEYVEDLGSLNGVWLNGHRFQGCELLQVGDKIVLGATTLEYRG